MVNSDTCPRPTTQGKGCPVSQTYTDPQFMVPQGCSTVRMAAQV
jgi:hypothetical protein